MKRKVISVLITLIFVVNTFAATYAGQISDRNEEEFISNAIPATEMSLQELYEQNESEMLSEYSLTDGEIISEAFIPEKMEICEPSSKTVLGDDNRWRPDPWSFPYSTIACLHLLHYRCGCGGSTGSGFMVGKNMMITAAHCLVCREHNQFVDTINFEFGVNNGKSSFSYYGNFTFEVGTKFPDGYTKETALWDYAYIWFDENIGDTTGWLGSRAINDAELDYSVIEAAGYRGNILRTCYGTTSVQDDYIFNFDADIEPGNSGGPVFEYYNNDYYAIGVISNSSAVSNYSRRLTNDIINRITANNH